MTIKSFVHFFKSGGVKGRSPLWDFKGQSPLTNKNPNKKWEKEQKNAED